MGDESLHPLTPEEAKVRLRLAAQHASPSALLNQYPWRVIGVALLVGVVVGKGRLAMGGSRALGIQVFLPMLIGSLLRLMSNVGTSKRE